MDKYVYNAIEGYFSTLGKLGYYKYKDIEYLILLVFYYNLIYNDYRGYIVKEDYHLLEQAMNCLYGVNCLIPYPDYLKMGKLKLGEMTEILDRLRVAEQQKVVKGKNHITDIPDIDLSAFDNIDD